MRSIIKFSAVAAVVLISAAPAFAGSVDLSSATNADLNGANYFHGSDYPGAGATVSIKGIDFTLSSFNGSTDAGTIQTGNGFPTDSGVISIAPQTNVGTIYTLINAAFPFNDTGAKLGNLTFNFLSGKSFSYDLISGSNIRDHVTGVSSPFEQDAPDVYGTASFGTDLRLDAQKIFVPVSFASDTLVSFELKNTDSDDGNPFLVALTTAAPDGIGAVPEPASWAMMIGGIGFVGAAMRRRYRASEENFTRAVRAIAQG